jgi:hypothetical protein
MFFSAASSIDLPVQLWRAAPALVLRREQGGTVCQMLQKL